MRILLLLIILCSTAMGARAQYLRDSIEKKMIQLLPQREPSAPTGSELADMWSGMDQEKDQREARIAQEILAGNFPDFMRKLARVELSIPHPAGESGDSIQAIYWVMPDYLMVGSDEDFLRVPMQPQTAQKIADQWGFFLSTAKIADDVYKAAAIKLAPIPMTEAREAFATYVLHHHLIEDQRKGRTGLIAGIKKDVISTVRLLDDERSDRVALYGWHKLDGLPIQPVYTGHVQHYVDYSHGFRLVGPYILVNDEPMHFTEVMADPLLRTILSDEPGTRLFKYPVH